jgi:hypothetical protein
MGRGEVVGDLDVGGVLRFLGEVCRGLPVGRRCAGVAASCFLFGRAGMSGPPWRCGVPVWSQGAGSRSPAPKPTSASHRLVSACTGKVMWVRGRGRSESLVADAGEQPAGAVAEPSGDRGEQHTVLVAVAASPAGEELGRHPVQGNADAPAEEHVKVFGRDRGDVRAVQVSEGARGRVERAVVVDPGQVGGQIEFAGLPLVGHRDLRSPSRRGRSGGRPGRRRATGAARGCGPDRGAG